MKKLRGTGTEEFSFCKIHNTYPAENEPCWKCIDNFAADNQEPMIKDEEMHPLDFVTKCNNVNLSPHHFGGRDTWKDVLMLSCNIIENLIEENGDLTHTLYKISNLLPE